MAQFSYPPNPVIFEAQMATFPGMALVKEGRFTYLIFSEPAEKQRLRALLALFTEYRLAFDLFDPLYPSPSDPGAYLTYFIQDDAPGWKMTLGNHGWTGGVYTIPEETIVNQLFHLLQLGQLPRIKLGDVIAFTHYANQPEEQNEKQHNRLLDIHSHSPHE